jgi:hypothetical protein
MVTKTLTAQRLSAQVRVEECEDAPPRILGLGL